MILQVSGWTTFAVYCSCIFTGQLIEIVITKEMIRIQIPKFCSFISNQYSKNDALEYALTNDFHVFFATVTVNLTSVKDRLKKKSGETICKGLMKPLIPFQRRIKDMS